MMKHLQKPVVQMLLLLVVVSIAGTAFYLSKQSPVSVNTPKTSKTSPDGKPAEEPTLLAEKRTVSLGEKRTAMIGSDDQVERLIVPTKKPAPPSLLPTASSSQQQKAQKPPPFPKLVHVSSPSVEPFVPKEPRLFAPRGILIKAALVITVDSSSLETPVLGLVTEDVYWNHQLVLPAGTQVHAKASNGRTRDRIEIKGSFNFIWDDGREYSISGVALDHERLEDGSFSITDGSAGIRGQIIKNDEYAEVKILIAEALEGMLNNNQQQFQSIYGLVPQNTGRNAALGGGSQAASAYSGLLTKKLDQDLDFVRVAAGTQFYIYTLDVFEPELASIAGLKQKSQAVASWQLAEEAYTRAQTQDRARSQQETIAAAEADKQRKQEEAAQQIQRANELISGAGAVRSDAQSSPAASGATPVILSTSSRSQP